ncbi:hypothetical protein Droror1_Dr00000159, partial [Drosera rotundifolia]
MMVCRASHQKRDLGLAVVESGKLFLGVACLYPGKTGARLWCWDSFEGLNLFGGVAFEFDFGVESYSTGWVGTCLVQAKT